MKIYLAAAYARRPEIAGYRDELESYGLEVTSRWLKETLPTDTKLSDVPKPELKDIAEYDIDDIIAADALVHFTVDPEACIKRAGATFEGGYAYGRGKMVVFVGPKQHIFAYLPAVVHFDDWADAKQFLITQHKKRELEEETIHGQHVRSQHNSSEEDGLDHSLPGDPGGYSYTLSPSQFERYADFT